MNNRLTKAHRMCASLNTILKKWWERRFYTDVKSSDKSAQDVRRTKHHFEEMVGKTILQ
jgi:hypothetical protein